MLELTILQKAIMQAIKKYNASKEDLERFNKGIKFKSMGRYLHRNYEEYVITMFENLTNVDEFVSMVKYEVKCYFKPANKGDNNIVKYMINIYSDGSMGIYFDGTEYE